MPLETEERKDGAAGIAMHIDKLGEALGVLEGRMDAAEEARKDAFIQLPGLNEMRKALGELERARSVYSRTGKAEDSEKITKLRDAYEKAKKFYEENNR